MYRLTKAIQVSEYREWESNPHIHKDTWPSTMPVYQFQHLGINSTF